MGLDAEELLSNVEAAAENFRESVIADALYTALTGGARATLAALTVCRLPVDRDAALAISDQAPIDLDRASGATLIEVTLNPTGAGDIYRVAPGCSAVVWVSTQTVVRAVGGSTEQSATATETLSGVTSPQV